MGVYSGDAFHMQLRRNTILSQYDGATGEFLTLTHAGGDPLRISPYVIYR